MTRRQKSLLIFSGIPGLTSLAVAIYCIVNKQWLGAIIFCAVFLSELKLVKREWNNDEE